MLELQEVGDSLFKLPGLLDLVPKAEATSDSTCSSFQQYAERESAEGRDLRELAERAPGYLVHVLRPATESVEALGCVILHQLPLVTLALVRIAYESVGLAIWII